MLFKFSNKNETRIIKTQIIKLRAIAGLALCRCNLYNVTYNSITQNICQTTSVKDLNLIYV